MSKKKSSPIRKVTYYVCAHCGKRKDAKNPLTVCDECGSFFTKLKTEKVTRLPRGTSQSLVEDVRLPFSKDKRRANPL